MRRTLAGRCSALSGGRPILLLPTPPAPLRHALLTVRYVAFLLDFWGLNLFVYASPAPAYEFFRLPPPKTIFVVSRFLVVLLKV
jgi:hypothetical protein